jgi:hypothetical protein
VPEVYIESGFGGGVWLLVAWVCAAALTLAIGLVVLVPVELARRALEARERRHPSGAGAMLSGCSARSVAWFVAGALLLTVTILRPPLPWGWGFEVDRQQRNAALARHVSAVRRSSERCCCSSATSGRGRSWCMATAALQTMQVPARRA